ncbi:ribonuclease H-like domain-containing protein [Tanacetum coccineum]
MTEAKGDGGEGLYPVRADEYDSVDVMMAMSVEELLDWIMDSRGSYHMTYTRDYLFDFEEYDGGNVLLSDDRECRIRGTCKVQVQMRDGSSFVLDNVSYVPKLRRNLISLGTLEKEGFAVKMQSGKIKVIKGSLVVLSGTRRANCVYTVDDQVVTRKTLKGRKQLGEYQAGWKIKTGNVLDFYNRRSTQQCTKSGVVKHLGVAVIHQQNELVKETNVTLLAKVVLYRNMGFNESGEYKKTFIGSGVGTGSVQVLQGVEFEVEPQDDHTFEVEPHGNVDHVTGSQEVQTQDLIYYHLARDREQHSTHELFNYREDNNEAAFAVAAVDKIYAHESLTFSNTVACKVISKWKAGLKDDIDARSDVYAEIWATKGLLDKAKGNVLGMEIVRDQSGNTLRVSQSRFYNGKLVHTLLEGHSILSFEGSLSGDCDVERMMWISHKVRVDDTTMYRKLRSYDAKEVIWLKGLAIESGFKLKIVAGIATGALSKAIPGSRFQHRLNLLSIAYFVLYLAQAQQIIRSLHQEFAMTDLGPLNYFLGISVTRDSAGLFLSQKKYVVEILDKAHMVNCNPSRTPIDTESKLGSDGDLVSDPTLYWSLADSLQCLTFTRPDISYAVQHVCLYMHDPRESHFSALKRILRYVRGTLDYGLQLFSSSTTDLVTYSDADWAGCPTTRRSTSGYCVFLGNNLLSWSSKRQPTLSRSSAEAEYRGVANAVAETCWLRNLLRELHTPLSSATLVYCDNVSAVYLSCNPAQHQRTKHIEIDIHFVRDLVAVGQGKQPEWPRVMTSEVSSPLIV